MTNQHVLSGFEKVTFFGADGTALATGRMFVAKEHDVAIVEVTNPVNFLQMAESVNDAARIGQTVLVPGNSLGGGVVTEIVGKVRGIGPQRIEVDAKFVSGNSGSPIILFPDKKVIGVATYTQSYELKDRDKEGQFQETRWFGYRIDSIQEWALVNWSRYSLEGKKLIEIEQRTLSLIDFFNQGNPRSVNRFEDIRYAIDVYQHDIVRENMASSYYERIAGTYLHRMQALLIADIEAFLKDSNYDFHRERAKPILTIRKYMRDHAKTYLLGGQ